MRNTPFAAKHRVKLILDWYGTSYTFFRQTKNSYGEPEGEPQEVQEIRGIYHSSQRSFIELISMEGASIKNTTSRGILCGPNTPISILQGDSVTVDGMDCHVTAIEPIWFGDVVIGKDISLEEIVREGGADPETPGEGD